MLTIDPKNSQKTQRTNSASFYNFVVKYLKDSNRLALCNVLDYGSGKCIGSNILSSGIYGAYVDSYEPYPLNIKYNHDVRVINELDFDKTYHVVVCSYVLCVVTPLERKRILKNIDKCMHVGSQAFICARDVREIDKYIQKSRRNLTFVNKNEPHSYVSSHGTYQHGFTEYELLDCIRDVFGNNYQYGFTNLKYPAIIARKQKD